MSFQAPLSIKEAIQNIDKRKYYLPAIQREFVWDTEQIIKLFDSLMRDYPIGSFLFWYVEKKRSKSFQFYEFIKDYHEKKRKYCSKAKLSGEEDIIAILDGQQRFTALYIALKGTYAEKLPRKRWENDEAFPKKELYLNLVKESDEEDLKYDFKFLTDKESELTNIEEAYWFKVSDVLNFDKEYDVNNYLINNGLMKIEESKAKFANETLFKFYSIVHKDRVINYFLEQDEQLDKVLNIFIRVNSGGTILSYSDLLLSIATAQWAKRDAREEINSFVEYLNSIGSGFDFNKDFVLKSCLVLNDFADIAFKVDNFNSTNMSKIESNWESVKDALKLSVLLLVTFGYSRDTLTSNNAIIPIAYYLLKQGIPKNFDQSNKNLEDRKNIQKWLTIALLKRSFGGQPDSVIRPLRQVIGSSNSEFPYNEIVSKFKGQPRNFSMDNDEIENLFLNRYGQKYTFSTLALLQPNLDFRNSFHVDHIFPDSLFTLKKLLKSGINEKDIPFYLENYNTLVNLHLMEGIPNQEKSSLLPKDWIKKNLKDENHRRDYFRNNFIPDINLGLENFKKFVKERRELMLDQYKKVLQ